MADSVIERAKNLKDRVLRDEKFNHCHVPGEEPFFEMTFTDIKLLTTALLSAVEELRFYGGRENWIRSEASWENDYNEEQSIAEGDFGSRARTLIKKLEEA